MTNYIRVKFVKGQSYIASIGRRDVVATCLEIIKGKHRKARFKIDGEVITFDVDVDQQEDNLFVEVVGQSELENFGIQEQCLKIFIASDLVA